MLKAISRASFQRSSTTHFGTLSGEPPIQTAPPPANHSSNIKSKRKSTQKRAFNAQAFLDSAGVSRKVVEYRRSEKIYSQGEPATSVMYIQKGGVKISVVNEVGKEAVVAILGPADFFGEGCLAGQSICMGTATAITPTAILVIEKNEALTETTFAADAKEF